MKSPKIGWIEIITGCMASGKTEELIRRIETAEIAKQDVGIFKPRTDTRSKKFVSSRKGCKKKAIEVNEAKEILQFIDRFEVFAVDEVQFFSEKIVSVVNKLSKAKKRVILSGTDTNFRGEPFGIVPNLIAIADEHTILHAVCMKCHSQHANRTQRLINGKPAPYNDDLIKVGGDQMYEARCKNCHEVPGKGE